MAFWKDYSTISNWLEPTAFGIKLALSVWNVRMDISITDKYTVHALQLANYKTAWGVIYKKRF